MLSFTVSFHYCDEACRLISKTEPLASKWLINGIYWNGDDALGSNG